MVELTLEQAKQIANMLGTLPANQCYNEITILLQAIAKADEQAKKQAILKQPK